jgi:hypothetical protein
MPDATNLAAAVWNRAILKGGGSNPREGALALASLMAVHGLVMNGGVEHSLEVLGRGRFSAAVSGFRYFGFTDVAALLASAAASSDVGQSYDAAYGRAIPDDAAIVRAFENSIATNPDAFAPWSD